VNAFNKLILICTTAAGQYSVTKVSITARDVAVTVFVRHYALVTNDLITIVDQINDCESL
jgi:hypothetical protein